jgi:hypothetical protein
VRSGVLFAAYRDKKVVGCAFFVRRFQLAIFNPFFNKLFSVLGFSFTGLERYI